MPTTKFLLYNDPKFSKEYKMRLREQIRLDFQIVLPDENEEKADLSKTRKKIVEAVGLIKSKVGNGRLLLQFNIEYGFWRNLIGGSIFGILMSLFNIIYFFHKNNIVIGGISVFLAFSFAILLILHRPIINSFGSQYAERLFQEYLQL
ncbi:hypothetical protein EZS27_016499 [termite gut metagenome]|uniref:Uncharacterized protein n=1 Tax=termite gut metagenome TaxID=433724 RepID=A0A5J4RNC8_9ZZZZ